MRTETGGYRRVHPRARRRFERESRSRRAIGSENLANQTEPAIHGASGTESSQPRTTTTQGSEVRKYRLSRNMRRQAPSARCEGPFPNLTLCCNGLPTVVGISPFGCAAQLCD